MSIVMPSHAMALDKYHLTKKGNEWRLKNTGSNRARVKAPIKADAMKQMQGYLQTHEGSVRIHKEDDTIQEERTYPRSKDPRRSKGLALSRAC